MCADIQTHTSAHTYTSACMQAHTNTHTHTHLLIVHVLITAHPVYKPTAHYQTGTCMQFTFKSFNYTGSGTALEVGILE